VGGTELREISGYVTSEILLITSRSVSNLNRLLLPNLIPSFATPRATSLNTQDLQYSNLTPITLGLTARGKAE